MDRGAWQAIVLGVAKSQTWLKQLSMHTHSICYRWSSELGMGNFKKVMLGKWSGMPLVMNVSVMILRGTRRQLPQESFEEGQLQRTICKGACNAGDPSLIPGSGRSTGEEIGYALQYSWASLVAQLVNNPPAMQETWVWPLWWEDPLEKGKVTHSSILTWRIPWSPCSPWDCKESDLTERLSLSCRI